MRTCRIAFATAFLGLAALAATATTYTVTNAGDSGAGSLRQAILDANANAGVDTIAFNIPGSGVQTISPVTALPAITEQVTIDGYSQPGASANTNALAQGSNAVILIEIDGLNAPPNNTGLALSAPLIAVRGLALTHWYDQVHIISHDCVIAGNFLGIDATGDLNPISDHIQGRGILIDNGASGTQIGGPNPADRNVISGNYYVGILSQPAGTVIQGNLIGTDTTGTRAIPNPVGVQTSGSATIGGAAPGEGNVIAGNHDTQIWLGAGSIVQGNFIGTDATGSLDLGAFYTGIIAHGSTAIGGIGAGEGNTIANNRQGGVLAIAGIGTSIRGNRIHDNGYYGIGVGTGGGTPNDETPNDPGDGDVGTNGYQNYPIVSSVDYGASTTTVHASFNSKASTVYDIDFYANPPCLPRPVAHDQGHDYIGSIQVATDGAGDAAIDAVLPLALEAGQVVTTIATDPSGSSSVFSRGLVLSFGRYAGPAAGGNTIELHGQLLESGVTVTLGGVPATNVVVTSPLFLTFTTPPLVPGSVNELVVTNPGAGGLSTTIANGMITNFNDVPATHSFYSQIMVLVGNEITAGVGGGNYGPSLNIKRQSMAVFLLKAKHGVCYVPPPCTPGYFADVACPSNFANWIQEMAVEGITGGCGGGNFCPDNPVRRDQMAVFLLKGSHGSTYTPPACAGIFTDVACPSTYANWIEELKKENITGGCGTGTTYCPSNNNTRAQMAAFIQNAFLLLQ